MVIAKSGKEFEDVSKLFDHAAHNGSNYLNGHCFVSLMLCVPVWQKNHIVYRSVPLGYRMWTKEVSKLELAVGMVCAIMPELALKHQVLLLFDSWYAKKSLACLVGKYKNLDIICNAWYDSAIYDLPPATTGKKADLQNVRENFPQQKIFLFHQKKLEVIILAYAKCLQIYLVTDVYMHM